VRALLVTIAFYIKAFHLFQSTLEKTDFNSFIFCQFALEDHMLDGRASSSSSAFLACMLQMPITFFPLVPTPQSAIHIPNKPFKISKKAFATFAGENDPSTDDAPEKNPNQKKPKKGTPNKRNKRQASKPPVAVSSHELPICLTCGLIHKLANCYHAFPELASSYFRPKDELAAQVKEKLANNIDLQKQLKKLKKARRSSSSKSIKMSDTPVPNTTVE
jgi:hypothetical protein